MRIGKPYNATLLSIIAKKEKIIYAELQKEYCVPTPPGVVSSRNIMFDADLEILEAEGYISRVDDLIIYIRR